MKWYMFKIWLAFFARWSTLAIFVIFFIQSYFYLFVTAKTDGVDLSDPTFIALNSLPLDFLFSCLLLLLIGNSFANTNLPKLINYNNGQKQLQLNLLVSFLSNWFYIFIFLIAKYVLIGFLLKIQMSVLGFGWLLLITFYFTAISLTINTISKGLIAQISLTMGLMLLPAIIKYAFNLSFLPNKLIHYPLESVIVGQDFLPFAITTIGLTSVFIFFNVKRLNKLHFD